MNPFAALAQPLVRRPGDVIADEPVSRAITAAPLSKRTIAECQNPWGLTPAQCEVMHLSCRGFSYQGISRRLGISHKTVGAHMDRLKAKLEAESLAEAKAIWTEHFKTTQGVSA